MRFEERMTTVVAGAFDHVPPVFRVLVAGWLLVGLPAIFVPDLYNPLPYWIRLALLAPVACMLVFFVLPIMVVAWLRLISWPFRKATELWKRTH